MDERSLRCIDTIDFFSAPAAAQIASYNAANERFVIPRLFLGGGEVAAVADYFKGVGCVFKSTYRDLMDEVLPEFDDELLLDINHRLDVMMNADESEWSIEAVKHAVQWQKLRLQAKYFLSTLSVSPQLVAPVLDVATLINISDFVTTNEVARLLRDNQDTRESAD